MQFLATLVALSAVGADLAASQPHPGHHHHHGHAHLHHQAHAIANKVKRIVSPVDTADVTVATVYVLNGQQISPQEVQQGIANGTLMWADPAAAAGQAQAAAVPAPAQPSSTILSSVDTGTLQAFTLPPAPAPAPALDKPSSVLTSLATSLASSVPDVFSPDPTTPAPSESTPDNAGLTGVDADFPDGELDCSEFPEKYGALPLPYLGIGSWSGIQSPGSTSSLGFSNILTVVKSACSGPDCCSDGMFCSYACPAGYQKSQWPTIQGSTGQSVGGIQCKNGKLYLTNKSLSTKLCVPGAEAVNVQVHNKMSDKAAVCRTDYPGTEGETIPLNAKPGTVSNLTCPDAAKYYTWEGKSTSAQYYVNPKGSDIQEACQWGDPSGHTGNYAPLNLGVGYNSGSAWLSIFQNSPTTDEKLNFNVEIVGNDGGYDNLAGRCKYHNGQYCSGDNYENCSPSNGCTVSASSGTLTFVFTE